MLNVNITKTSEHPPQNIEIVRSDYAQKDVNKKYSTLSCEVEKLHWNPQKMLEEFVNSNEDFFREDIILVTVYAKRVEYSYIRVNETTYKHYKPHNSGNRNKGAYVLDSQVPKEREKYKNVNKKVSIVSVILFVIFVTAFLTFLYRAM